MDRPPSQLLREPPRVFVGRERELQAIATAFENGASVVGIFGAGGVGKTALANEYIARNSGAFPAGVALFPGSTLDDPEALLRHALPDAAHTRGLMVVEYAEAITHDRERILTLPDALPNLRMILLSRVPVFEPTRGRRAIELGGIDFSATLELLRAYGVDANADIVRDLLAEWNGRPLLARLLGEFSEQGLDLDDIASGLGDFEQPGILGPDGLPLRPESEDERRLVIEISEVNDELLRILRTDPQFIRNVNPRKFEQIVAEILSRLGYEVRVTPESRDGGFDISAAKKETVGSFLYLVECKRYTPPNKVGVGIVRSLHGVVQAARATAGLVVTSSFFTKGAQEFRESVAHQMQLKDYVGLQHWLRNV